MTDRAKFHWILDNKFNIELVSYTTSRILEEEDCDNELKIHRTTSTQRDFYQKAQPLNMTFAPRTPKKLAKVQYFVFSKNHINIRSMLIYVLPKIFLLYSQLAF